MSDKLFPLPVEKLLGITLNELDNKGSYFGIPGDIFYTPPAGRKNRLESRIFDHIIQTPIGIAAGPHSQMAQNIVAAWLMGARYIELKTVQTLDNIDVPKPCIDMQDEGYNCEWSQELSLRQSFDEYLKAWVIIHVLNHRMGRSEGPGVVFNMSAGYDLEGIRSENMRWFFGKMTVCPGEIEEKREALKEVYPPISDVSIPGTISDNITLSTMHGCPAGEIESIAGWLMEEKGLHTYVKLNPTLLGPGILREILNGQLGFKTVVPDQAFEHDLRYDDAVRIIKNLRQKAGECDLEFGLKLTNTLETLNKREVFNKGVDKVYMSGRALHPLAVKLASILQEEFEGSLSLSFSGGADAFNTAELLACGFKTVTSCSDLLKPGGMMRIPQYLEQIHKKMAYCGAESTEQLVTKSSDGRCREEALRKNLREYFSKTLSGSYYKMEFINPPNIKTNRRLELFDCISAPCRDTCATLQDIPEYLLSASNGEFQKSHETILRTNPFPSVTGMICDHLCQDKCTRLHYDEPLLIREVKRFCSGQSEPDIWPAPDNGLKTSIIGAGPAGLSCAYFLALAGFSVEVFEKLPQAGGMVRFAIPGFRLSDEALDRDIERIRSLGVKIHYNRFVDREFFKKIKEGSDFVFAGPGAPKSMPLDIEGIEARGVLDPLSFLFAVREGKRPEPGRKVVIIGGGNTAMDAARTASRLTDGEVIIVYRRTINQMPADQGEIRAAMQEGVRFIELCGPVGIIKKKGRVKALRVVRMELSGRDLSGRPKPVRIKGSEFEIECDTVIPAIGQKVETGFIAENDLKTKEGSYLSRQARVFTGGDAMRGASTAINAIGDGRKAAGEIFRAAGLKAGPGQPVKENKPDNREIMIRRSRREFAPVVREITSDKRKSFNLVQLPLFREEIVREAGRCLQCDELCNTCVTVCPNLANYPWSASAAEYPVHTVIQDKYGKTLITENGTFSIKQSTQILNIADFCNECGNCETFCPTADAPYRVKPKIHLGMDSFNASDEGYYLSKLQNRNILLFKDKNGLTTFSDHGSHYTFESNQVFIELDANTFGIREAKVKLKGKYSAGTEKAAAMHILLEGTKNLF